MFCQNCGTKLIDGAVFCQKCGAKVAAVNIAGQMSYVSPAVSGPADAPDDKKNDFKEYIDDHVKKVTEFQSAEELLRSSVSLAYVKICYGIFGALWIAFVLTIVMNAEDSGEIIMAFVCLIFFFVLGAGAACMVGGIKKIQYSVRMKPSGKVDGHIDPDALIRFLNSHLNYLSPYFDEWDYYKESKYARPGLAGRLVTAMENTELRLGSELGKEHTYQCFSIIHIRPDLTDGNSGRTSYICEAKDRIGNMFGAEYSCLVRTAPILQAVMEYYIENDREV